MSKRKKKSKKGKPEPNNSKPIEKQQHGGYRQGAGRPEIIVGENFFKEAEKLAKMQCTQKEIAGFFEITGPTLIAKIKEHYGLDYLEWFSMFSYGGQACLRRRLWEQAMEDGKDSVKASIWLSKNYLGLKDNVSHNVDIKPLTFCYSLESDAE